MQSTASLALAVLAADPPALQSYLRTANVSIALIKSLLQLPARDPDAFRQKLERILAEVLALRGEAAGLGLTAIVDGAREFEGAVASVAFLLVPAVGLALSALWLGEPVGWDLILGGALIVASVLLAARG